MSKRLEALTQLWQIKPHEEAVKVAFLTLAFLLIISAYTLAHELKDALFVTIVGRHYVPIAKIYAIFVLIPPILLFSRFVDLMRKHQLLYLYTIVYGVVGLIITYFLAHPTIGLANTNASKYRAFGWFIYFFMEGYVPFVVSLFWAFVNSVTIPNKAKNNYPLMIAGSKIGGISATVFAVLLLKNSQRGDIFNHQVLLGLSSVLLLAVPIVIYFLMKKVPKHFLVSYETTAHEARHEPETHERQGVGGIFSGLILLLRYPYVLGVFAMTCFWEIINVVFAYERLGVGQAFATTVSDYSRFLFTVVMFTHIVGLLIALLGTRFIINWLGEKRSLTLVPASAGLLLLYYFTNRSPMALVSVVVMLRALNYGFTQPLRESLYVPTARDIRFKSKSWIDGTGSKAAKAAGSLYNRVIEGLAPAVVQGVNGIFFSFVIGSWLMTAYFLGKRFERAVRRKEVIGVG